MLTKRHVFAAARTLALHLIGRRPAVAAVAGIAGLALTGSASASIILNPLQASGQLSLISGSVTTPNPGNDNVPGLSTNLLNFSLSAGGLSGGHAAFNGGSGPPTEYTVTNTVTNNTGVTWIGYTLSLANGTRTSPVLQPWYIYDFDLAPTLSGSPGSWSSPDNNTLKWTGLNVAPGQTITFVFNMDLPIVGAGGWWIDQYPTQAPAPGAAGLASLAALSCARRRR